MREMNILQEADLPYFEQLEKEGKAVILRFDDIEDLLDFDIETLLARGQDNLDETAIRQWIQEEQEKLKALADSAEEEHDRIAGINKQREYLELIRDNQLPNEDRALIMQAIDADLGMDAIMYMLKPEITHEQRQLKYQEVVTAREKENVENVEPKGDTYEQ